jgi:GTP-sensing pleiotropic transcriptional regulator CodY
MSFGNEVISMLCNVHSVHEGCKEIEILFKHSSNYSLPELSMMYNTVIKYLNNLIEVSLWSFATKPDILGFSLMILLQEFTVWDL